MKALVGAMKGNAVQESRSCGLRILERCEVGGFEGNVTDGTTILIHRAVRTFTGGQTYLLHHAVLVVFPITWIFMNVTEPKFHVPLP